MDTFGTTQSVLLREVSLIEGSFCTQLDVAGTVRSVLLKEVSFIQGCPLRGVPLYCIVTDKVVLPSPSCVH